MHGEALLFIIFASSASPAEWTASDQWSVELSNNLEPSRRGPMLSAAAEV
jgi:hypothetical protein